MLSDKKKTELVQRVTCLSIQLHLDMRNFKAVTSFTFSPLTDCSSNVQSNALQMKGRKCMLSSGCKQG